MDPQIDIILITGFLGAGKTTMLKHVFKESHDEKTGLIINEYSILDVDGSMLEGMSKYNKVLSNGSIFCACLKDSFEKTLLQFLSLPVTRIFIEASGMADPFSMNKLIEKLSNENPDAKRFNFRGCVCVVDACNIGDLREQLLSPTNQIKKSSLIVLNKVDMVSEAQLSILENKILKTAPGKKILRCSYGKVDPNEIDKLLSGEAPDVGDTTNTCGNRPYAAILNLPSPVDEDDSVLFLKDISPKFIRTKGFFSNPSGDYKFESSVFDDVSVSDSEVESPDLKIVLISLELNDLSDYLSEAWKKHFKGMMFLEEQ